MAGILRAVPGVRVANVYRYPDVAVITRTRGMASNAALEQAVRRNGYFGRVTTGVGR